MVLLESRGFTKDHFSRFHPGGALGRALRTKVNEIVRINDPSVIIKPNDTIKDALSQMNKYRSGACIITNEDGTMAGIFTHGDFARSYQQNLKVGDLPVSGFMTHDPVTLSSEYLAAEAITSIGVNFVDDLVVLDANQMPIGLIDAQDFAHHKLV
jgi:arabinose-5-phosphate isomerase